DRVPSQGASGTGSRVAPVAYEPERPPAMRTVVRAQSPDVPPPPPPPPPPASFPGSREEGYNCGVATDAPGSKHPFLDGCGRFITGIPTAVTGAFTTTGPRALFQSDPAFPQFISPVSNPFYFEDPRALTEVRPIFIYQRTPNSTPIFRGSDV